MAQITINIPDEALNEVVSVFANQAETSSVVPLLDTNNKKAVFIKTRIVAQIKQLVKQRRFQVGQLELRQQIDSQSDVDLV